MFFQESVESEAFFKLFEILQKLKNPANNIQAEATGSMTITECTSETTAIVYQHGQNQILQDIPVGVMNIPVMLEEDLVNNPEMTVIHDPTSVPHFSAGEETSPATHTVTLDQPLVTGTSQVSYLENGDSAQMEIDRSCIDDNYIMQSGNNLDVHTETENIDFNTSDMAAETEIRGALVPKTMKNFVM